MPFRISKNFVSKTFFLMNWTAALLLAGFLQVSADGFSQSKITLTLKNAPLEKVFSAIESQSEYTFWYDNAVLKNTTPVDIDVRDVAIEQALADACKNQPLIFSIVGKLVVIQLKNDRNGKEPNENVDISGRILSETGEPVVGAAVLIKGTARGTQTDAAGNFSFPDLKGNEILIVSSVGYETKEIHLSGKSNIDVVLKIAVSGLDETVIKGYYNTTRRLNTGDVSSVSAKTIAEQPVSNPLEAMEGRAPGLVVTQETGLTGGGFFVQIRGQNFIGGGNDPLYVIDGIPFPSIPLSSSETTSGTINKGNPLSSLNPSDIESISILKDADATAIYGSRGANGVVLISTKKGRAGHTKVDAGIYFGAGHVTRMMNLLNTPEYLQMRKEAFLNDGLIPNAASAPDLLTWDTTRNTNWEKNLIGNTSHTTDAQISVSGGDVNTQFLAGMGYHQESTVYPGNFGSRRISGNLNLSHQTADQKLKFSFYLNYSSFKNNLFGQQVTPFSLITAPDAPPVYDSTGKLNWAGGTFNNPYASFLRHYSGNTTNLLAHADISYLISSHFQLLLSGGYNEIQVAEILTYPKSSFNPRFHINSGRSFFSNNSVNTWILEPQILYKTIIGRSSLQILLGSTFEQDVRNAQSIFGYGYSSDALLGNLQAASSTSISSFAQSDYKYEGLFGRVNYNWQDCFLINLTARRDGSSRFGPGRQFANFGAIGAGWIFTKTSWIQKHLSVISFGKIRASYGLTGNDQIGDYEYLDTYSPTQYAYFGTTGLVSTRLYNPNYSWETNRKLEAGLDLNFWKNRISTTISWYRNRSSDQLIGYPLPLITGQSSVQENSPATVQNRGWEFELGITAIKSMSLQWNITFNMTVPQNKLIAYPNLAGSAYANTYVVGKSLYVLEAFHYTGADSKTGIYTFKDINHDGQITYPEDLTTYKEIAQSFFGGLLNSFEYHRFHLDIFFQFVKQTGWNYLSAYFSAPGMMSNQPALVLNRWRQPGDQKPIQMFTQDYGSNANTAYGNVQSIADNIIGDASFIRLKNISFSYTLKQQMLQKIHVENCTIFIQGQNLLTITHFQGLDPENQNVSVLPPLRIISAGLRCSL